MLDIKNVSWSVKQLSSMSKKGNIRFDYPIQRSSGQWNLLRKSNLIHTLAQNYPVFPMYFLGIKEEITVEKKGMEKKETIVIRWVLDGKQRILSTIEFLEDGYSLHSDTDVVTIDHEEYEIAGKKFSELDEEVQDMIVSRTLLTYTIDGDTATDEEIEDLFYRMNDGVALTTQQKTKALMGVKWAERLNDIGLHPLIQQIASFSSAQIRAEGHLTAIMQTMMMLDKDFEYKNVSQKVISEYALTFKEDTDNKVLLLNKVREGMDYLLSVFDKKENILLKKVHFPMMVITALRAKELGVHAMIFYKWANDFKEAFRNESAVSEIPTNYKQFTGTGSTDRYKADGRLNEMIRHMEAYISLKGKEKEA